MLPPTDVNIHSRANQSAPADSSPCQASPLTDEGNIVPIVWLNGDWREEKREKLV